jgi:hypothetical protein
MKNKLILLCIFVFIWGSCNTSKYKIHRLNQKFNAEMWKTDTCGMSFIRYPISQKILKKRHLFIGLNKSDITNFLGSPDFSEIDFDYVEDENFLRLEYYSYPHFPTTNLA